MSYRRYISEVRFGADRAAVTLSGNRTVYDYWAQIDPACGQLLVTPQWRPSQGRVSFTWQQSGGDVPFNAAELKELRTAMAAVLKQLSSGPSSASPDQSRQAAVAKVAAIVRDLSARTDEQLSGFACRTPAGLRLHSWGAAAAAHPLLLETPKQDIRGQLVIDGGPVGSGEVLLQTMRGATLERTRADASGNFTFTGVAQGLYRIRPVFPELFFATPDVSVSVTRDEPAEVILRGSWRRDASAAQLAAEQKSREQRQRRRRTALLAFLLLLLIGTTGRSIWSSWQARRPSGGQSQAAATVDIPRDSTIHPAVPSAPKSPPEAIAARSGDSDSIAKAVGDDALQSKSAANSSSGSAAGNGTVPASSNPPRTESVTTENPTKVARDANAAVPLLPSVSAPTPSREDPRAASKIPPETKPQTPSPTSAPRQAPANQHASRSTPKVVAAGNANAAPSTVTPSANVPPNTIAAKSLVPSTPFGAPPTMSRVSGASTVAPDAVASGRSAPNLSAAIPPRSSSGRSAPTPAIATVPAGVARPPEATSIGANGSFSPANPPEHTNGNSVFIPVADGGGGPGKIQGPVSPDSASRGAAATQSPGNDHPGAQRSSAGGSGSGGAGGTIIGGIAILGSPNVGGTPTRGENETEGTNRTDAFMVTGNVASSEAPRPAKIEAQAESSDTFEARPEAALHLDVPASRDPANAAAPVNIPSLASANRPGPDAAPSSFINSSILPDPTYSQPKTILLHLGWELRHEESLIAPETATLRDRLLAANLLKMPRTLRDSHIEAGIVIELPPGVEVRPPVWRDKSGAKAGRLAVAGNRAEFSWQGRPPKEADYVLESTEGELWAHVIVDQDGVAAVSTAPGARRSYWVGVLRSPEDDALLAPADATSRLQWCTIDGHPLPRDWRPDNSWRNGHGYRLEIPLDETDATPVNPPRSVGLVDPLTGWVLVNPFAPRPKAAGVSSRDSTSPAP